MKKFEIGKESEWFSPAKRNYYPISTDRRKIG